MKLSQKAMILANQLRKYSNLTKSEALTYAWDYVKNHNDELHVLKAAKKNGTVTSRVVFTNWNEYNTVKGTGRATKPNQRLFVDVAKREAGLPSTVSFYDSSIILLAA